jgi:hypothetical protein
VTDENEHDYRTIKDLPDEVKAKIGLNKITIGGSADSKVVIKQYETMGVFSSMSLEVDLSAFSGEMPFDELFNNIAIPIRNSLVKVVQGETMARTMEMRAYVEGVRDGRSNADIERNVRDASNQSLDLMKQTFEPRKNS